MSKQYRVKAQTSSDGTGRCYFQIGEIVTKVMMPQGWDYDRYCELYRNEQGMEQLLTNAQVEEV